jgi:micrococcal nuclease
MSLRTALLLLSLAAVAAGFGGQLGVLGAGGVEASSEGARVERVVDGDTVKVRIGGRLETVRYIGMDTPETKKPRTPVQCYGKNASHENERLVAGQRVELTPGVEPRDRYGRMLAYVRRSRDGLFVNEALLKGGFARTLTIAPNDRYAPRFAAIEAQARLARKGLWRACR